MNQSKIDEIARALQAKGADRYPCGRCGSVRFLILDASSVDLDSSKKGLTDLSGLTGTFQKARRAIPTIVVGCENCGHIFHHSLGLLGVSLGRGLMGDSE